MELKSGIYKIVNTVTGSEYIGQTNNFTTRWKNHTSKLKNGIHPTVKLQEDYSRYGSEAFAMEILEYSNEDLLLREKHWIMQLQPFYNNGSGMKGKKHTEEAKRKIGNASSERIVSDQTRKKLSDSRKKKSKSILCLNNNETYDCIKTICEELNLNSSKVSDVLRGIRKHTKQYVFQYIDKK